MIGRIWLAELALVTGDADAARAQLEECVARARLTGSPYPLALSLLGLGRAALDQADVEAARRHLEAALAQAQDAHLGHIEAAAIGCLGEVAVAGNDRASAEAWFERARAVAERSGEKRAAARAAYHLAGAARARGDVDRAVALHHDALRRFHDIGARPGVADSLDAVAGLAVDGDRLARAARLFGAAAGLRRAGGWARRAGPYDRYERDVAQLRERMGRDELERAWAVGGALCCDDAVAYASRGRGRRARPKEGPGSLTRAERQVVALAVEGLTTGEIAERLFISPRTVHSHLGRIYAKLGVASRRELRRRASDLPPPT